MIISLNVGAMTLLGVRWRYDETGEVIKGILLLLAKALSSMKIEAKSWLHILALCLQWPKAKPGYGGGSWLSPKYVKASAHTSMPAVMRARIGAINVRGAYREMLIEMLNTARIVLALSSMAASRVSARFFIWPSAA